MRKSCVAGLALLVTACGTTPHGAAVCGACAGAGYVTKGAPDVLRHAVVTVCVAGQPCGVHREPLSSQFEGEPAPSTTRPTTAAGAPARVSSPRYVWSRVSPPG